MTTNPGPSSTAQASGPGPSFRDEARLSDAEAVRALVAETGFFNAEEIGIAVELVRERLAKGPASGYEFVFAEHQGRLIGYACYGAISGTQESHDLYWIVVHPSEQGRGFGRVLLRETESRIHGMGGRRVYVETSSRSQYDPTRAFYERCAYQKEAVLADFYAPGDSKVIYVKVLPP